MQAVYHSEIFFEHEEVLHYTLPPKVLWSEVRHADPRLIYSIA